MKTQRKKKTLTPDRLAAMNVVPAAARDAASAIEEAFHWRVSKEGHRYWQGVVDRLNKIAAAAKAQESQG